MPVLTEQTESRTNITSKFGTWGIGSKGATEDWDDDFDFSGSTPSGPRDDEAVHEIPTINTSIFVPYTIREQQTKVLANIGLLKEWGLLIEELKELRTRASMLGLTRSSFQATFDEVDAMIDLADQEAHDEVGSVLPPFSTATPDFDEPDEPFGPSANSSVPRLVSRQDSEDDTVASLPDTPQIDVCPSKTLTPGRPRKNSEAIARSVINAIQQRKDPSDLSSAHLRPPAEKMPFDKGTLRHILPHLTNLVKAMKSILKDAEGLSTSPKPKHPRPDPPFSHAFIAPIDESPSKRGRNRLRLDSVDLGLDENDAGSEW